MRKTVRFPLPFDGTVPQISKIFARTDDPEQAPRACLFSAARDGSSDRQSCGRVRLPRSENIFPFYPPGFGDGAAGVPQQFPPGERSGGVAAVMISSIPPQAVSAPPVCRFTLNRKNLMSAFREAPEPFTVTGCSGSHRKKVPCRNRHCCGRKKAELRFMWNFANCLKTIFPDSSPGCECTASGFHPRRLLANAV